MRAIGKHEWLEGGAEYEKYKSAGARRKLEGDIVAEMGIPTPLAPPFSRPLFARFAPSFRRSFAVSGFLAPRRRERAKNGGKWAKFGGETAEKQR